MPTQYNIDKFIQGINGFGLPVCTNIYSATLAANTAETVTVPASSGMGVPGATIYATAGSPGSNALNKFVAVIICTPSIDTFLAINQTVALPAGGTLASSTSELIPNGYIAKLVKAGDVIGVKSAGTPSVTISFYSICE